MSKLWEISTGKLYEADGEFVAEGYAGGACGQYPDAINNPDMCDRHGIGPLPPGLYKLGTPIDHSTLGPFAIPLIPDPSNQMHGRSAFYIHGDAIGRPRCASDGCIILPRNVRDLLNQDPDRELRVVSGENEAPR
jgi:Protein of unknown function (DUF2778)